MMSRTPLRNREFGFLFAARAISELGTEMIPVALAFAVLEVTGSIASLGLVLGARTLGTVLFVLLGGASADLFSRRSMMIAAEGVSAATQVGFAALVITGSASLWQMTLLQLVAGVSTAFFWPAATAVIPEAVPTAQLQQANALIGFVAGGSAVLGPALAGLLVAVVDAGWVIGGDGLSFALSALLLSRLRVGISHKRGQPLLRETSRLRELVEGWTEARRRRWLWVSILHFAVFQPTFALFFVAGPVFALDSLGGASAWGLVLTSFGVGGLLGSVVAVRLVLLKSLRAAVAASFGAPPALLALALGFPLPTICLAAAVAAACFSYADAVWNATLQSAIPSKRLGRVLALDWAGSAALRPLGLAAAGPLIATFGKTSVLLIAALLQVSATALPLLVRDVRSLQRALPGPPQSACAVTAARAEP